MPRPLTDEQRRNVQASLLRLLETQSEAELQAATGIPQPTLNALKLTAKVGYNTARRLAAYLYRGQVRDEDMALAHLLSGTEPATEYAAQEIMYPTRGIVLDRLRGVIAKEVLDEVAAIELPEDAPRWTELEWLQETVDRANRRKRLGK